MLDVGTQTRWILYIRWLSNDTLASDQSAEYEDPQWGKEIRHRSRRATVLSDKCSRSFPLFHTLHVYVRTETGLGRKPNVESRSQGHGTVADGQ